MNLTVNYLGLNLPHPIMAGASPFPDDLDRVRLLEDAGAPVIIMHSRFEEHTSQEFMVDSTLGEQREGRDLENVFGFYPHEAFRLASDKYLKQLQRIKAAVSVPIIASLKGTYAGQWIDNARLAEAAGADALELNIYCRPTDAAENSEVMETRLFQILRAVKEALHIPIAVKLSPFYSTLPSLAKRLDTLGVDALVLFNRFPQLNLDAARLELSRCEELPLRLRWTAVLHGQIRAKLAISGGVRQSLDVVKAIMAGATAVQTMSSLLHYAPSHLAELRQGLKEFMEESGYSSVSAMRGCLSAQHGPRIEIF